MTHPSYLKTLCHMIDYQHIVGRQRRSYKVKMWHCDMGFSHYDEVPLFSISSAFRCVRRNYAWLVKVDSSSSASLEEVWLPDKLILSPLTWWDPQFWLWRCCCSYSSSVGSSSPQFASTCPAHCETPWSGSTISNYMKKVILSTVLGKVESTQT